MVMVVAPRTFQKSCELPPDVSVSGDALNSIIWMPVLLRAQPIAELQSEHHAAAVVVGNQRLVQARFNCRRHVRAEWLDQAYHTAWLSGPNSVGRVPTAQPQVSDVALGIGVAPQPEQ